MTSEREEQLKRIEKKQIQDFLESLLGMKQEVRCLREQKDQIAKQIISVSASKVTGEVRGAEIQDIGKLLERLEDAQERVVQKMIELLDKEALGTLLIDKHPDRTTRAILRARYVVGSSWKHIATGICGFQDISYPQKIKKEALDYLAQHTTMREIVAEARIKRIIK